VVTGAIQYSIIIPVCNEAKILPLTIPSILAATKDDEVQIIYVCNACTDGSAELIRQLGGASVQVVEISSAGKTKAFNVGDGRKSRCRLLLLLGGAISNGPSFSLWIFSSVSSLLYVVLF